MNKIFPPPLQKSDMIGVMSPSSYIEKDDLNNAVRFVEQLGYKTLIHSQTLSRQGQSAGTNEEKLNAFHNLVQNKDVKAIIFSTGGNRSLNWVDDIDWNLVKSNPKIMMGFSDITPILNLVTAKTGIITYHGPNLRWFIAGNYNALDTDQCFKTLSSIQLSLELNNATLKKDVSGQLIGGNLPNFQYLINELNFENKVLFLEDWNEEYSRLDRMLCHLKRSDVFNKINALILGQFENMLDTGRPYGFDLHDMIAEHVPKNVPVIFNAPFGHGNRLCTLPIGQTCHLNFDDNCVTLSFDND